MSGRKRKLYKFKSSDGVLSARGLAEKAGISTVTMSRILRRRNLPSMATLHKLAAALDISIAEAHKKFGPKYETPQIAA